MHNKECITCDICGQMVALITRSGFFNRPTRGVVKAYVTLTETEPRYPNCWRTEGDAKDHDVHLCSSCFQSVKLQVMFDKRKENNDEQKTND